ncbi:arginine--tRNA ligase [Ascoidea rubescens DSM 1968]|uniref:arginine--tRNA ligase n=1 Tax=Ascoidea rubescens DSM 1968 TaxID=1344418 RepID=A0A1D2VPJ1_9ASCO|nr:arginyl-tRNA synthetase [Ascoidea rubescens DSM 1968]ODV63504.1 arginyl-tRNA synthetase [Ascoidea rubescens DSM 1968]
MASVNDITSLIKEFGFKEPKSYENSHPQYNPIDIARNFIAEQLSAITGVSPNLVFDALNTPNTLDKGDLIIPIPRLGIKGNPKELAAKWADALETGDYLDKIEAQGPFIQFFLSSNFLFKTVIKSTLIEKESFGSIPALGQNKKIIIEFSSPNIAKPFHAGHLRSTIIGGFLSNLYEALGWEVIRMNYLGDWGKQFGLLAVGFEKYGSEEKLKLDPINHLFDVYVKINNDIKLEETQNTDETNTKARLFFKKMEDGDEDSLKIWKRFRELSIGKYIDTYARLNIKYQVYSGESTVPRHLMDEALQKFKEKNLLTEDKGALLIDFKKFNKKKLGKAIVQKSDGTTLYLTRDIGAAIDRYNKYKFDKMIYVIASQQDLHTAQFFEILKQMGYEWANNLVHVNFGMVLGMSTRQGTVVFLDDILEQTKSEMHNVMQKNEAKYAQVQDPDKVADLVGISAVMIQDMSAKRIGNYSFKWERMLSFEGDTGPYLQYAHSRLCSVARNSNISYDSLVHCDYSLLTESIAATLIRLLAQYPDILLKCIKNHEPSTLVTYLFNLTHTVSSCYNILWVAGQKEELATSRLALYLTARQILYNGMRLLGITPVERM